MVMLKCTECDVTASTEERLNEHYNGAHRGTQEINLNKHMEEKYVEPREEEGEGPDPKEEEGLDVHKRIQHKLQVKKRFSRCPYCDKVVKPVSLKQHLMIHTAEKVFECNLCYKKFLKRSYLHNHQRTVPVSYTHLTLPTNREV